MDKISPDNGFINPLNPRTRPGETPQTPSPGPHIRPENATITGDEPYRAPRPSLPSQKAP